MNGLWLNRFPSAHTHFSPRDLSDHCPAVVHTGLVMPYTPKPFQFFNFMIDLPNFNEVAAAAWSGLAPGDPLQILARKLRATKQALCTLNKANDNLSSNVEKARNLLHMTQTAISANPSDLNLLINQRTLSQSLWAALCAEEKLLRQKSRIQWLKEGDRNSGYFHNQIKNRWNQNKVLAIVNSEWQLHTNLKDIQNIAVNHFRSMLGAGPRGICPNLQNFSLPLVSSISPQQAASIERDISDEEILATLKSMKKNKSPGPDGFNVNFFLHYWNIVGRDFTLAIQSFFKSGCLLRGTNSTAIVLVPKVLHPSSISDYRPISCCNTTYKCISKILASRLKVILPLIISPYQVAFVAGRRIGDNILLAQELFWNYHRPSGPA